MSRSILILIFIILLIIGGLWYLSGKNTERPLTRVEKTIPNEKLGK